MLPTMDTQGSREVFLQKKALIIHTEVVACFWKLKSNPLSTAEGAPSKNNT